MYMYYYGIHANLSNPITALQMVDSENEELKKRLSSSGGSRSPPPVSQPTAASSARPPPYSAGNRGQGVRKTILVTYDSLLLPILWQCSTCVFILHVHVHVHQQAGLHTGFFPGGGGISRMIYFVRVCICDAATRILFSRGPVSLL
jgi:hypothetical protein